MPAYIANEVERHQSHSSPSLTDDSDHSGDLATSDEESNKVDDPEDLDFGELPLTVIEREIQAELDAQLDEMLEQQWNAMMQEYGPDDTLEYMEKPAGEQDYRMCIGPISEDEEINELQSHDGASTSANSSTLEHENSLPQVLHSNVLSEKELISASSVLLEPVSKSSFHSIQATIQQVLRKHGYQ